MTRVMLLGNPEARTTAAIVLLMAVWWTTEALPLAVTVLVPIVAFPLLGVVPRGDATATSAPPTVFLFMGGFMIAIAMRKWNLRKRIVPLTMRAIGAKPRQIDPRHPYGLRRPHDQHDVSRT